jgi:hypothetical protein
MRPAERQEFDRRFKGTRISVATSRNIPMQNYRRGIAASARGVCNRVARPSRAAVGRTRPKFLFERP